MLLYLYFRINWRNCIINHWQTLLLLNILEIREFSWWYYAMKCSKLAISWRWLAGDFKMWSASANFWSLLGPQPLSQVCFNSMSFIPVKQNYSFFYLSILVCPVMLSHFHCLFLQILSNQLYKIIETSDASCLTPL